MASSVPDIQDLVKTWARDTFYDEGGRKEKALLKKDKIGIDVDWSKVSSDYTTKYTPEPPPVGKGISKPIVLCTSTFSNSTPAIQNPTFKVEKSTKRTLSTTFEKQYTKGGQMSVKLSTPSSILEANAGFKEEVTLRNSETAAVEETQTWSVDCPLAVQPGSTMEATMSISEEEYAGNFEITTSMRGKVIVVYRDLKKDNSFIERREAEIYEVISKLRKTINLRDVIIADGRTQSVICKTSGKCSFKYGINQKVDIHPVKKE